MSSFKDKNILIGVTGSIAAYKAVELIRLLTQGANIKVVMTNDAKHFITELTLQAVSGSKVFSQLLDPETENSMSHIALAKWADLLLVVPATANVIAKFALGLADDLLSTLYLASKASTVLIPAMNQQMWQHPATISNIKQLQSRGVIIWGPDHGSQACGDYGPGRMIEPSDILTRVANFYSAKPLKDIKIVITAGPTREPIDPVRYISNYSSGKMGYALARAASNQGAQVTLVSGPTHLPVPDNVNAIYIESAQQMHRAVSDQLSHCDIFIGCAAVVDFRSKTIADQKIKKSSNLQLDLEKNIDIIDEVAQLPVKPFVVGFAAESENLIANAKLKLQQKNLDIVIANLIGVSGSGFDSDHNQVSVLTHTEQIDYPLMPKDELAQLLIDVIHNLYKM